MDRSSQDSVERKRASLHADSTFQQTELREKFEFVGRALRALSRLHGILRHDQRFLPSRSKLFLGHKLPTYSLGLLLSSKDRSVSAGDDFTGCDSTAGR